MPCLAPLNISNGSSVSLFVSAVLVPVFGDKLTLLGQREKLAAVALNIQVFLLPTLML
jgi:MFS-type transporter involved in bile tolerance (Atg22 family)